MEAGREAVLERALAAGREAILSGLADGREVSEGGGPSTTLRDILLLAGMLAGLEAARGEVLEGLRAAGGEGILEGVLAAGREAILSGLADRSEVLEGVRANITLRDILLLAGLGADRGEVLEGLRAAGKLREVKGDITLQGADVHGLQVVSGEVVGVSVIPKYRNTIKYIESCLEEERNTLFQIKVLRKKERV